MHIIISLFCFLLFALIGHQGLSQPDTSYWENGKVREIRLYGSADHYFTTCYHPNGSLHFSGFVEVWDDLEPHYQYIDTAYDAWGKQTLLVGNGELIHYFEDLTVQSIRTYSEGTQVETYAEFYENGKVKVKGGYGKPGQTMTGYKQGIWDFFDASGVLQEQRRYRNGNESYVNYWKEGKQVLTNGEGYLEFLYDNDQIRSAGKVKEGKKYGVWTAYDPEGKVCGRVRYFRRRGVDYAPLIGFHSKLLPVKHAQRSKLRKSTIASFCTFHSNGKRKEIIYFSEGKADSTYLYYENGQLFKVRAGTECVYYESGTPSKLDTWNGETYYWATDGTLVKQELFQELSDGPYLSTTTTNHYDANGRLNKQQVCLIKLYFDESDGVEYYWYDCHTTEWDESGNKK